MTSVVPPVKTWQFSTDSAATGRLNTAQADNQLEILYNWAVALEEAIARVIRDDDTLVDGAVRLRHLTNEVSELIASADGWKPKVACDLATTANVALTGEQTIDGTLTSASRVLVKDNTLAYENGLYDTAAGAWTRCTDADDATELAKAAVYVAGGIVNIGASWVQTAADIVVGTTDLVWAQFGTSGLEIPVGSVTNAELADVPTMTMPGRVLAGTGVRVNLTASQIRDLIDLEPDGASLETTGGSIQVKNLGISTAKLAALCVIASKIAADAVETDKIKDAAVTTPKLADSSVTAIKLDPAILANASAPVGSIMEYAGTVAPTGWVFCDGTAYDRTNPTYTPLFAVIGTTYGVGGGGNDFQVPDRRGRVAVGAGTGAGLTARVLGATGGEETHVQIEAELAPHTHTAQGGDSGGALPIPDWSDITCAAITRNIVTTSTGSGTGFNVMQPFIVQNFIVKL